MKIGCRDGKLVSVDIALCPAWFLAGLQGDSTQALRRSKRYSGVSCDPTGAPSPSIQYSRGGWLNFQSLKRRINAFEKTA